VERGETTTYPLDLRLTSLQKKHVDLHFKYLKFQRVRSWSSKFRLQLIALDHIWLARNKSVPDRVGSGSSSKLKAFLNQGSLASMESVPPFPSALAPSPADSLKANFDVAINKPMFFFWSLLPR